MPTSPAWKNGGTTSTTGDAPSGTSDAASGFVDWGTSCGNWSANRAPRERRARAPGRPRRVTAGGLGGPPHRRLVRSPREGSRSAVGTGRRADPRRSEPSRPAPETPKGQSVIRTYHHTSILTTSMCPEEPSVRYRLQNQHGDFPVTTRDRRPDTRTAHPARPPSRVSRTRQIHSVFSPFAVLYIDSIYHTSRTSVRVSSSVTPSGPHSGVPSKGPDGAAGASSEEDGLYSGTLVTRSGRGDASIRRSWRVRRSVPPVRWSWRRRSPARPRPPQVACRTSVWCRRRR